MLLFYVYTLSLFGTNFRFYLLFKNAHNQRGDIIKDNNKSSISLGANYFPFHEFAILSILSFADWIRVLGMSRYM